MTFASILTELRDFISDASSLRWSDSLLRSKAFAAEVSIVGLHPEAQYITRVSNSEPTLLAANTDSFTIETGFRNALLHLTAALVLEGDSDDANNMALASYHRKRYAEEVGGK